VSKNSRNSSIKTYFRNYFKVLSKVIKAGKKLNYQKQIRNLNNKVISAWEIIYSETGRKVKNDIQSLNINGVNINNQQNITDVFSNNLLTTAVNITDKNISNTTKNNAINIMLPSCILCYNLSQQNILT
jgi:hypothetical protein